MQQQEKPKQHKTLSDKLRKKREELKKHKKEKKIKKEAYNVGEAKEKYFGQSDKKKKDSEGIKVHKLKKALRKFTKVFEDDLEDFYDIWRSLDEGSEIQLEDIENLGIQKALRSICKHLHLKKSGNSYLKPKDCETKLVSYVKSKMEQIIEDYLQNGTESEPQDSEEDRDMKVEKHEKKKKQKKQSKQETQPKLEPKKQVQQPKARTIVGPSLPPEMVRQGQSILVNALTQSATKASRAHQQPDQMDLLFGSIASKKPMSATPQIPDSLYAAGSAKLHQQETGNQASTIEYLANYNKECRPKSLMQIHKQMVKDSEGQKPTRKPGERVPFSREQLFTSDRVDLGQLKNAMQDGVFFNFGQKMSKPTINKSFL